MLARTVVAGVGANALVGGSNHSVALQPLSVQGQVGLNAAAGIGAARPSLRAVRPSWTMRARPGYAGAASANARVS